MLYLLLFLIDLYYNVCHSRLCEGTDEGPIFIRKVWDCWCSNRCWYTWLLNVTMVFEFLILIGIEFHSFVHARYWDSFLSHSCSSIIYSIRTSEPFLVIPCDTLLRRSKLIFLTFEFAEAYIFLYTKDESLSRKILSKLIHFKSRNSGVTWSRFKYFPLLATFAAKLIHFCLHMAVFHCIYTILNYNNLDERR